jgi:hypothetical protein
MKQTVNLYQFREAFRLHERTNFSYEGLEILFDYLEECESGSDTEFELDVIGLCCDYAEDRCESISAAYNIDIDEDSPETCFMQILDALNNETEVCGYNEELNLIIYRPY